MKQKRQILESDLYKPISDYFERLGYDVHGEVKDCDMTVSKGDELIIIELKRNLSLELFIQAIKRQRITENVYIAIPKPKYSVFKKKWKDLCYIVRRLELGLITVSFKNDIDEVNVVYNPSSFDRRKSLQQTKKKRSSITHEINGRHGNYNLGGSTRTKFMTAYKENSLHIACCLRRFGQLSPCKLRELGTGDKTQSILYKNFHGWFERTERGIYILSEKGNEAFSKYPELIKHYDEIINMYLKEKNTNSSKLSKDNLNADNNKV